MRILVGFIFSILLTSKFAKGQDLDSLKLKNIDSLDLKSKSKLDKVFKASDSVQELAIKKIAILDHFQLGDTESITNPLLKKINILSLNQKADSLKISLSKKKDSLVQRKLPIKKYAVLLDSLNKVDPTKNIQVAEAKLQKNQAKLVKPLDSINKLVKSNEGDVNKKLGELNKEGAGLPSQINSPVIPQVNGNAAIANLNMPTVGNLLPGSLKPYQFDSKSFDINELKSTEGLKSNVPNVMKLPNEQLNELKKKAGLGTVKSELKTLKEISGSAKSYTAEAENVVKERIKEVKELPKTLEGKVSETALKDITNVQNQTNVLKEYRSMLAKGFNKDDIKKLAEANLNNEAVNHFAGKEKELTAALEQMSKYKLRYPTATEVRDITKGVRNEMAGKSFRQRTLAGFNLQFQTRNDFIIDINPWAGFRLSGKWVAGLGWVERVQFHSILTTIDNGRMFGPRIFTDIKWKKGIAARGEMEFVNAYMPSVSTQDNGRMWLFGYFAGLKKDYKFSKKVKGNFQVLYNLSNYINKASPYADKINVRMGFEFGFKKR